MPKISAPFAAIYGTAQRASANRAAQSRRDATFSRPLNRFGRTVESVDRNAKMLIAMLAYHLSWI
jgi:hypothetical protein